MSERRQHAVSFSPSGTGDTTITIATAFACQGSG
jgi:hypothetical protein